MNPRNLSILIPLLLLAACEIAKPPFKLDTVKYEGLIVLEASSQGDLISRQANRIFELDYARANRHKAIAQSVNGVWAWSHDQPYPEAAIDQALEKCAKKNKSGQDDKPCKLVIVDVYWAGEFIEKRY